MPRLRDLQAARNINSIDESLATYKIVCDEARAAGVACVGYLSTCFFCPFEGAVDSARVAGVAARLFDLGVFEVAVSDTIGAATPGDVLRVLGVVSERLPLQQIALHFHDTRGTALANVLAGLDYGVTTFDSSAGGLGGCPFAPGAAATSPPKICVTVDGLASTPASRSSGRVGITLIESSSITPCLRGFFKHKTDTLN